MRKILNNSLINYILSFLVLVLVAKLIGLITLYFLPKSGVEIANQNSLNLAYKSYRVAPAFGLAAMDKPKAPPPRDVLKIDNLILHALYGEGKQGFIVFAEKATPMKNNILAVDGEYKGYKLVQIRLRSAILEKGGKNYELVFKEGQSMPLAKRVSRPAPPIEELGNTDVLRAVNRKDVMFYAKNFKKIWKNIAIKEIKRNGKIDGFKIMSVKQQSIFAKLGLLQGDVIKSINNQPLKSYADAFKVYDNIKDYDALKIEIIRKNTKKELEYEIF